MGPRAPLVVEDKAFDCVLHLSRAGTCEPGGIAALELSTVGAVLGGERPGAGAATAAMGLALGRVRVARWVSSSCGRGLKDCGGDRVSSEDGSCIRS